MADDDYLPVPPEAVALIEELGDAVADLNRRRLSALCELADVEGDEAAMARRILACDLPAICENLDRIEVMLAADETEH